MTTLSLIVAVAANGAIGKDNALPWRLPEDLRYFKRVTMGKPVVMGRRTFDSIGKPLPGRTNIVVTGNPGWSVGGVETAASVPEALALARRLAPEGEVMVIGGARLFDATIGQADRLYLTEVHRAFDGDVFFVRPEPADWREVSRQDCPGDPPYSFVVLEKRSTEAY